MNIVIKTAEDVAREEWELSKIPTQTLKDELEEREHPQRGKVYVVCDNCMKSKQYLCPHIDTPEQNDVCEHNFEMGYCVVEGCEGGI